MRRLIFLLLGVAILAGAGLPKGAFLVGSAGVAEEFTCAQNCVYDNWPKPIFSFGFGRKINRKFSWSLELEARPFRIEKLAWKNPEFYDEYITEYFLTYSLKYYPFSRIFLRGYIGLDMMNFYEDYHYPVKRKEELFGFGPFLGIGVGALVFREGCYSFSLEIFARRMSNTVLKGLYANFFGVKLEIKKSQHR